jgi:hypothetical protein
MPIPVVNFLKQNAKKQGRTMSNYLRWLVTSQMDETEYLMSSPANKKMLLKSIEELNSGKAKLITKTMDELYEMEKDPNLM